MGNNTKQLLVEAAIKLFSEKGFAGTGVDEIAQAVGVKGPNLYKHFKGKDDLLNEILNKADEEYTRVMEINTNTLKNIHSKDEFRDITFHIVEFTINNEMAKKMRRIYTIEQFRNELFADCATKHQFTNMHSTHCDLFARLMDENVMKKGDPDIYALEFVAPITLLIQLVDRDPSQMKYAMDTFVKHMDVFIENYFIN